MSATGESAWSDAAPLRSPTPPAPPTGTQTPAAGGWAGPSPTNPVPTSTPTATPTATPTVILDELVGSVAGVRGAILASVDGFGLAHSSSMADEAAHPAMLAAAVGLGHQLVEMSGGTRLRQLLVDHDGGLMLVWPLAAERILAVLASNDVDQRGARSFVQRHADGLATVTT